MKCWVAEAWWWPIVWVRIMIYRYSLMPLLKTHLLGSGLHLKKWQLLWACCPTLCLVTHPLFRIGLNQVMLTKKPGAIIRMELWPASLLAWLMKGSRWPSVVASSAGKSHGIWITTALYCWRTSLNTEWVFKWNAFITPESELLQAQHVSSWS